MRTHESFRGCIDRQSPSLQLPMHRSRFSCESVSLFIRSTQNLHTSAPLAHPEAARPSVEGWAFGLLSVKLLAVCPYCYPLLPTQCRTSNMNPLWASCLLFLCIFIRDATGYAAVSKIVGSPSYYDGTLANSIFDHIEYVSPHLQTYMFSYFYYSPTIKDPIGIWIFFKKTILRLCVWGMCFLLMQRMLLFQIIFVIFLFPPANKYLSCAFHIHPPPGELQNILLRLWCFLVCGLYYYIIIIILSQLTVFTTGVSGTTRQTTGTLLLISTTT